MKPNGKVKRKARNTPGHSHFLVFSTYHKRPYLTNETLCDAFADCLNRAAQKHRFAVLAYVFMPDHVHILIHPLEEIYSMELIMKAIKQGISNKAKRNGWVETDLWERGGGYDRNIFSTKARQEVIAYTHQNPVVQGLVEDPLAYRWSSCNWYVTDEVGDINCVHYPSLCE